MGLFSFLVSSNPIRTKFMDQEGKIDLLLVDATINETPNYESEISDYPVELGPDVTDNIRLKPITLSIDGLISESPITLKGAAASLATSAAAAVAGPLGGFNPQLATVAGGYIGSALFKDTVNGEDADGNNRALNPADLARKVLEDMWNNKQIFTIVTKRRKFESMVIEKLSFPRTQADGHALKFSISAKKIRIVQPETVLIKNLKSGVAHGGKKTNLGQQGAETANEQEKQQGSLLFQAMGALGIGGR